MDLYQRKQYGPAILIRKDERGGLHAFWKGELLPIHVQQMEQATPRGNVLWRFYVDGSLVGFGDPVSPLEEKALDRSGTEQTSETSVQPDPLQLQEDADASFRRALSNHLTPEAVRRTREEHERRKALGLPAPTIADLQALFDDP